MRLNSMSASYPDGNFGGNQLLDGSISLTPLVPDLTIDLHVRTATDLHQSFPLASSCPGIVHHLSGPNVWRSNAATSTSGTRGSPVRPAREGTGSRCGRTSAGLYFSFRAPGLFKTH
ncbi:hypothetical protein JTE90_008563 [Oedothorax gibbosus]|uniref:Uncharacterized protein n=1 Tax=Oedothorax gibbosus TaxID=931172 RepID=A0AAV6TJV4_9ARAC|nr:hypothetical protein JTE90_008563 [Oedothorax gibbosus]